jgi:hypothetical protein
MTAIKVKRCELRAEVACHENTASPKVEAFFTFIDRHCDCPIVAVA